MVDWLTISQASGSGNATITITASTYSGLIDRATSLKVSTVSSAISKYVTVQQTAQQPFTASPSSISDGGLGGTYQIEITSSHEWTATTVPAWVTLSQNSGSAGTVITVTLPENPGADRTASLVFTDVKGRTATVSLTQYEVTVPVDDCLTIEFEENGQVVWYADPYYHPNAQYSKNGGGWVNYDYSNDPISMQAGETIVFRSDYSNNTTQHHNFLCTGSCITYGNPLSLFYGSTFSGQTTGDTVWQDLSYLFQGNSGLTDASGLYIPQLSGINMFKDCINLVKAPKKLPTAFSSNGYVQMFSYMFSGCTSLTTPPMLPALTLVTEVYEGMFDGCTSLVNAPSLPATTIAGGCYRGMFSGCTSLVNAPSELPAASLAYGCYTNMFYGCTSLQRAPELPADYRITDMCDQMFYGCSSLNYIKCLTTKRKSGANQIWADNWVNGVNASGTFVKSSDATTWATGVHGIPSGWTVVDA